MPSTPPPQSKGELSTHYDDGYRKARFLDQLGKVIIGVGGLSAAVAFIIVLNAPKLRVPVGQTAYEAGRAAGIQAGHLIRVPLAVAVVCLVMGTFSWLSGRLLKKLLDT